MTNANLAAMLTALDASARALRLDECGDWRIGGKLGHVYADGAGFLLFVDTGESPRRWTNIKRRLDFCRLAIDGDDEGALHLDRLPTPAEAEAIRDALGIRKRRVVTDEARAQLEAARSLLNRCSSLNDPWYGTAGPILELDQSLPVV